MKKYCLSIFPLESHWCFYFVIDPPPPQYISITRLCASTWPQRNCVLQALFVMLLGKWDNIIIFSFSPSTAGMRVHFYAANSRASSSHTLPLCFGFLLFWFKTHLRWRLSASLRRSQKQWFNKINEGCSYLTLQMAGSTMWSLEDA